MKKLLLIIGILSFGIFTGFGQQIHAPAEIFKIMEESAVSYELNVLEL